MDQAEVNDAEWRNPENWSWGCYRSERDQRVWVPKQTPAYGITLNFARPMAWVCLAALLIPPLVVTGALVVAGQR